MTNIAPTDSRLASAKWFYLWSIGLLQECTCYHGTYRHTLHEAVLGRTLDCGSKGKHPFTPWFPHGSADALSYTELLDKHGPARSYQRLAMTLQDVVMIDIDSSAALRAFYRIRKHVHPDKVIGIAQTPRGYHLYLECPGWTQKAINLAMERWIGKGMWDGQDASKISWRGLVLDVRTGSKRYTVWPGEGSRDRKWVSRQQFLYSLNTVGRGMPSSFMQHDGTLAPWNLEMNDDLRDAIARAGQDTVQRPALILDGSEADKSLAWRELERWALMIEKMDPESGRNNTLNQTAYYAGADAIRAGFSEEQVRERLLNAAHVSGTPGAEATITSGLTSGWRDRYAAV